MFISCHRHASHLLVVFLLLIAQHGFGATFIIPDGDVTALASAITASNGNGEDDEIILSENSIYTLTQPAQYECGLPLIDADGGRKLTITGNGSAIARSTASGTAEFRILGINTFANVTITDLEIRNGKTADGDGGAIRIHGADVSLIRCSFIANTAQAGGAVSIYDSGSPCTFNANECRFMYNMSSIGGAVRIISAHSKILAGFANCSFDGNLAYTNSIGYGWGGAIHAQTDSTGTLEFLVRGSTFENNTAHGSTLVVAGKGITGLISNSTLAGNSSEMGGAISLTVLKPDTFNIVNSTFDRNIPSNATFRVRQTGKMACRLETVYFRSQLMELTSLATINSIQLH